MKKLNYQTGRRGEEIARNFLTKKGYRIVASNFRTRFGEIDLIAAKDNRLIFVEVKLKIEEKFGNPEEMINQGKLERIKKMAEYFLLTNPKTAAPFPQQQIDAVCIVLDSVGKITRISHYENLTL